MQETSCLCDHVCVLAYMYLCGDYVRLYLCRPVNSLPTVVHRNTIIVSFCMSLSVRIPEQERIVHRARVR